MFLDQDCLHGAQVCRVTTLNDVEGVVDVIGILAIITTIKMVEYCALLISASSVVSYSFIKLTPSARVSPI